MDESDYTMFADLPKFCNAIKGKNLMLIGLTAMATSSADGGSELKALEALNFDQYETDDVADKVLLDTDRSFPIDNAEKYKVYLWEQAMWKPLLVYARQPLYAELAKLDFVTTIDETTPHALFKEPVKDERYPVWLADEDYAIRGLDFRGDWQLVVAGSFQNQRARQQCLARVGRHGDSCLRVQDSAFPQLSQEGRGSKAGELRAFVNELQKAKETAQKRRATRERESENDTKQTKVKVEMK